ncbi:MAG: hypothetical protein J6A67_00925, partial [Clostridia bacterium]|nr:hypothetical protein [Clostridia bacterium]
DWGIFLQKTMKNQAFHEVSLRLLLRKIHLPLGKGGFAQLELICKSSIQTRICRNECIKCKTAVDLCFSKL